MRFAIAVAALFAFSLPGKAATFVQELRADQGIADMGSFGIRGQYFDPALGTLTGVKAFVAGTYFTSIQGVTAISAPQIPTTIVYAFTLFGPGNDLRGIAGTQFAYLGQGEMTGGAPQGGLTGGPYRFNLPIVFLNTSAFVVPGLSPSVQSTLGDFSIFTQIAPGLIVSREAGAADDSTFTGTFELTYTYDVPEPASIGLFCLGFLSVGFLRLRLARSGPPAGTHTGPTRPASP